jgi:type IV secretory pathway VirB4 component
MLILGAINYRKSTLAKTYLYRQILHKRQAWVIDIKGEYWPLAKALGVQPIRLVPGGEVRLNPLTPRGDGRKGQLRLLRSVAKAALRRELSPEEDAGLRVALESVEEECGEREPTLPMVVDALLHPQEEMVQGVSAASREDFAEANRESALALQRLCEGDLKGMFDGPTSEGLDLDAPLVVLDMSAIPDSAALGILMICAAAWLQAILLERKEAAEFEGRESPKLILVIEEGWRVTGDIGIAEWLQSCFKLCRGLGIQVVLIVHRIADLGASGAEGSREARIADALLGDAGTIVIHRQPPDQQELLRSRVGVSQVEAELTTSLGPGEALWVVGSESMPVRQRISQIERGFVYTDWRMVEQASGALA